MRSTADHRAEFADFTEEGYRETLRLARRHYRFARYHEGGADKHVLWRHDIDVSMHRALRLAEIEAEEGCRATYFLFLRCPFYNLLNEVATSLGRRIVALGHDVGLHFDPTQYRPGLSGTALTEAIAAERDLLEREFGSAPVAISFHNFSVLSEPVPEDDMVGGLVNAYSKRLRDSYGYVSDSNCVWLYRRLREVLEAAAEERLQVLTHPECWTPEAMAPRQRIQRAIDGYAQAIGRWYDDALARFNRPNLR
jgi:peptidoglycan/xylan/chitin deacetylase (PgdA/CDA1 family)